MLPDQTIPICVQLYCYIAQVGIYAKHSYREGGKGGTAEQREKRINGNMLLYAHMRMFRTINVYVLSRYRP